MAGRDTERNLRRLAPFGRLAAEQAWLFYLSGVGAEREVADDLLEVLLFERAAMRGEMKSIRDSTRKAHWTRNVDSYRRSSTKRADRSRRLDDSSTVQKTVHGSRKDCRIFVNGGSAHTKDGTNAQRSAGSFDGSRASSTKSSMKISSSSASMSLSSSWSTSRGSISSRSSRVVRSRSRKLSNS